MQAPRRSVSNRPGAACYHGFRSSKDTILYSRTDPSPRYSALLDYYRRMHEEGDPEQNIRPENMFDGRSLLPFGGTIKELVDDFAAGTILDYGAGKGRQYLPELTINLEDGRSFDGLPAFWGVEVTCYEPAMPGSDHLPDGPFDGVISTDVLEHCPEEDIPWILEEMFGRAAKFVFATAALYPAGKHLPTGENAHITIKPVDWWRSLIETTAARHPTVRYRFLLLRSPSSDDGDLVEG